MKLLIVEDDRDLVELLTFTLTRAGFEVLAAHDVPTALKLVGEQPDLVVLDVNLGPWNGLDVLREIRPGNDVPVIMLTGRDKEEDKVQGLDLGADDYITKPFSHRELIARIRALLRRRRHEVLRPRPEPATTLLQAGPITLNTAEHKATKDGEPLDLTVTEFRLLQFLMASAGAVVPTSTVLKQIWGYDDPGGTDVVRVTVHRLRRKLEDDPSRPRLLHTIPGVGFMVKPEQGDASRTPDV